MTVVSRCNAVCQYNEGDCWACELESIDVGVGGNCECYLPRKIMEFKGDYRWLSNFYEAPVMHQGILFPTLEHAYVAAKCRNSNDVDKVRKLRTPGDAKRYGRQVNVHLHWDRVKLKVMYKLVLDKFVRNYDLREKLLDTEGYVLEEGNRWNDQFWGIDLDSGRGYNHLGLIIMKVRDVLKGDEVSE